MSDLIGAPLMLEIHKCMRVLGLILDDRLTYSAIRFDKPEN